MSLLLIFLIATPIIMPLAVIANLVKRYMRWKGEDKMDEIFGGIFDFNNDGVTDNIELALGFQMISESESEDEE